VETKPFHWQGGCEWGDVKREDVTREIAACQELRSKVPVKLAPFWECGNSFTAF
jgi:hypothetical protein